jgi:tRNA U34 5-carboxymethylaminomethyl modifying enzyme MnmG/GidA
MKTRFIFPLIGTLFISIMAIYFLVNPSYEKSLEAKYYYETGDYKEAYSLAQEAFSMDIYNRMAATIMAQSTISLKYEAYITQAQAYLKQINEMATQENISTADRVRIKLMSEIVTNSYTKLAPSIITDKSLVIQAKKYHDDFEQLLEKVTK